NQWSVSNTNVGSQGTLAVVPQHTDVSISVKYTLFVACFFDNQFCDAEMKFGPDPGGVAGCFVSGTFFNPSQVQNTTTKTVQFDLAGSTMPKEFDIKVDDDGDNQCQHSWPFGTPNSKSVIAKVCVTP